jgi:CitMHS family citrate-Mg2+:H+ or citrate-Ca2+:H+ symporter
MLPTMIGGAAWVVFTAFLLGRAERKRIGNIALESGGGNCYIKEILATLRTSARAWPMSTWCW